VHPGVENVTADLPQLDARHCAVEGAGAIFNLAAWAELAVRSGTAIKEKGERMNVWKDQHVLVTGGAGFIGSCLVKANV
jgi:FlaA1/EpsC-like NDP-sugar epimerase